MAGDTRRYQIDNIVVINRFKNQVKSCKTFLGADCGSDHQQGGMQICTKLKQSVKVERKQTNYNFKDLKIVEVIEI